MGMGVGAFPTVRVELRWVYIDKIRELGMGLEWEYGLEFTPERAEKKDEDKAG